MKKYRVVAETVLTMDIVTRLEKNAVAAKNINGEPLFNLIYSANAVI